MVARKCGKSKKKLLFIILVFVCVVSFFALSYTSISEDVYKKTEVNIMEYQGPVPQGYNLEHFRKTGETIEEVTE